MNNMILMNGMSFMLGGEACGDAMHCVPTGVSKWEVWA